MVGRLICQRKKSSSRRYLFLLTVMSAMRFTPELATDGQRPSGCPLRALLPFSVFDCVIFVQQ